MVHTSEELLKSIIERLDVLVSLSLSAFQREKYDFSGVKLDVLELCNYEHTAEDMVKKLKKSRNQIDVNLSWLRSRGLIKSVVKEGKRYYVRIR